MDYVIIATIKTDLVQHQFVRVLQAACDGGAAGSFDTHPIEGGYQVCFFREAERGVPETAAQLALELEEADTPLGACPDAEQIIWILRNFAEQIRKTGWRAKPYGARPDHQPETA